MKPLPIHSDLDVLGFDVDPVDESQEYGSDYVCSERGKLLCNLTPTRDQSLLLSAIRLRIGDNSEHRSFIGEKVAEPSDD